MDIDVDPSGASLPAGSGNAAKGLVVYAAKCASCHGAKGEGLPATPTQAASPKLVGREPVVVADGGEVAGGPQQLLTATLLAEQGRVQPVDHGQVVLEVGDGAGHMGQVGHAGEGGAALEVDQDEVELF